MLSIGLRQALLCFLLGVSVAFVAVFTLGYTAAIAAPRALFDWFKSIDSLEIGLFLWDFTVVFGLGVGLLAFFVLLAAFRYLAAPTTRSVLVFLAGVLLTAHIFGPLAYGTPSSLVFSRSWWGYGFELSLIASSVLALLLARRLWPNNSFKPTSLRGAA